MKVCDNCSKVVRDRIEQCQECGCTDFQLLLIPFYDDLELYPERGKMNWWSRFWSNPYKWGLWHWVGGRQWTYIMRDFAYQNPMLLIIGFFLLGMWLRPCISWNSVLPFFIGMLAAHLFWGTKWRRGQGKKEEQL